MSGKSQAFYKRNSEYYSCIHIEVKKDGVTPKPVTCVQCGKCAKACPMEILEIKEA